MSNGERAEETHTEQIELSFICERAEFAWKCRKYKLTNELKYVKVNAEFALWSMSKGDREKKSKILNSPIHIYTVEEYKVR